MRILHIDPDDIDNPLSGGGPIRTFELYRRLAARHEITVLTPTFPGSTPELVREGIRYVRLGRRIGDHGSSHHITFFFELPSAIRRLQGEYDLVVEDFMPPMSATFNPLIIRKPLVGSVQWFFAETLSRRYKLPFFLGERYGIRLYRNFVVLTESMRRLIEQRHPRARCTVIPSGADESLFEIPLHVGDFILYLGLVEHFHKGVDLLLQAYAQLPTEERLPLMIAGHGYQWAATHARIAKLGLEDWVHVLGRVGHDERAHLLAQCRFMCVPSRTETFGMVIAEGCAAGKPVVAFDRPPMSEVAAPGVCELVEPFSVKRYAEAMLRLIRADVEEMTCRGAACRAWAKQFRWDSVAPRQEEFYRRVVEKAL